jgi:hypothetical protein
MRSDIVEHHLPERLVCIRILYGRSRHGTMRPFGLADDC